MLYIFFRQLKLNSTNSLFLVVRTMFEDLVRNGSLLRPADSAAVLVALLRKRNFKSGDHVDYYDDVSIEAKLSAGEA